MSKKIKIEDLKEWDKNPRDIDQQALTGLAASVKKFGDLSGIVWNERIGALVAGHQRMKALRQKYGEKLRILGEDLVTPDGHHFRIRIVDWDEDEHSMANVVANNPHIQGEYTPDLRRLMDDFIQRQPELFAQMNLSDLKDGFAKLWRDEIGQEDNAPPLPQTARTKLGDLYELGHHRLLCADSQDIKMVRKLMGGNKARLFCTDPPYGVNYGELKKSSDRAGGDLGGTRNWHKVRNDDIVGLDGQKFLEKCFLAWLSHLHDDAAWYLWHAQKVQGYFTAAAAAAGVIYHRQVVWVKPSLILGRGHYHWRHELCLYGWREGHEPAYPADRGENTVWEIRTDAKKDYEHPTQKPVECFARPMRNSTREGDICAEPFAGSGTQFIAAEQLKRRCFGMEIDPVYCDVTVQRWLNFTGTETLRLNGKDIKWKAQAGA